MSWTVPWPTSLSQHLFWAETMLVWLATNHIAARVYDSGQPHERRTARSPGRSIEAPRETATRRWNVAVSLVAGTFAGFLLPGNPWTHTGMRLGIFILIAGATIALQETRRWLGQSGGLFHLLAAIDLAFAALVGALLGLLIAGSEFTGTSPWLRLPVTGDQILKGVVYVGAIIFVVPAGNNIVRALLRSAQALPKIGQPPIGFQVAPHRPDTREIDEQEVNRGRIIGSLERLLLFVLVVEGSYEAMGFLLAAKGLIRAKELEDRDFAEYFIIGSLASALVAVAVAIAAKAALANP